MRPEAIQYVGKLCRINDSGDLMMDTAARAFIGMRCRVVKITKGGLLECALETDPKQRMLFAKRNVDLDQP